MLLVSPFYGIKNSYLAKHNFKISHMKRSSIFGAALAGFCFVAPSPETSIENMLPHRDYVVLKLEKKTDGEYVFGCIRLGKSVWVSEDSDLLFKRHGLDVWGSAGRIDGGVIFDLDLATLWNLPKAEQDTYIEQNKIKIDGDGPDDKVEVIRKNGRVTFTITNPDSVPQYESPRRSDLRRMILRCESALRKPRLTLLD